MRNLVPGVVAACLLLAAEVAHACSAFLVEGDGRVLAGNNEDYWDPDTKVWFVPGDGKRLGCVFFGFGNGFPQGGMNERGLFFDGFAVAPRAVARSEGRPPYPGNLLEAALAECATVEEVIALFRRHDLGFLERATLMFGDRSGDAVVVEGDAFVRKQGRRQVATNFRPSECDPGAYTCARWRIADRMLREGGEVSVDRCRRVLAAVHAEGAAPTQYSMVYDLPRGVVHLYHFHNFATEVVFDLAEELKQGARTVDLPTLFPETWAFTAFRQQRDREVERSIAARRAKDVDPETYDDYVGRYRLEVGSLGTWIVAIRRDGDRLLCRVKERPEVEILPEAKDVFFRADASGSTTLRFERSPAGRVVRVVLVGELSAHTAERVPD